MNDLKKAFEKQAKTCLATSLLYHDALVILADDKNTLDLLEEVLKIKINLGYTEIILNLMSYLHYSVLKKENSNLSKFYKTSGGHYSSENYQELKNIITDFIQAKKDKIYEWLINNKLQTNEVSRVSVILPTLMSLDLGLINLIELGCSSGLLLLMNYFTIDYTDSYSGELIRLESYKKTLECHVSSVKELRQKSPVHKLGAVKRIGLDLNIIDLNNQESVLKLISTIWDNVERKENLEEYINVFKERKDLITLREFDYSNDFSELISSLIDKDHDIVFFTSASTYQINDEQYNNLRNRLKDFSKYVGKKIYFIEFEAPRNGTRKDKITHEESFLLTVNTFPDDVSYDFARAHYHGKSMTFL